jgi:NAD(P)-dependent dehydrogenase (short-subunit alcohol dehydrogenase family)
MYPELKGRTALVTGGSSGLGECVVQHLLRAGAQVAIADLHADAKAPAAMQDECLRLSGDVSREEDVARFVQATHAAFGSVDILINCAGIPDTFQPTVDQEVAAFRRIVDVHLTGTYMMCKAVAPHMLAQQRGAIINLSSIGGVLGLTPRNAYSAAKAGIGMLTRTLACEWAASGVRVNAIAPGYILTPFAQRLMDEGKLNAGAIRRRTPAGRLGHPDHIAQAMLFLASDRSEFITGVTLPVDGGYMAWGAASDAWQGD